MPEGDVVWNTAQRLHAALAGQVLTRSDFRVPRYATVSLAGQTVTEALSRGKHLLIRTDRGLTVHTHLKMEGAWRIQPAGRFRDEPPAAGAARQRRVARRRVPARHHRGAARPHEKSRSSGTWAPTCSARTGTRKRPPPALTASPAGPSARHCSTSGTWPALGLSTWRRRCSCEALTRRGRSGRWRTLMRWCRARAAAARREQVAARARDDRGLQARAGDTGCTGGRGGRAGGAERRSGGARRGRRGRNGSGSGARTARASVARSHVLSGSADARFTWSAPVPA